ncbi:MAG: UvrD-helicase domain-containing protein [Bacteroidales bacterium]|nr:UvrD-helicase domain-containing protein [Bacteroidales bacterium]
MKNPNFKVFQASAGAGKTFTLIKEYLKLCLADKGAVANFRNILAITFTNAAANDMKAKIVKTLREIIDSEEVDSKSMEAKLIEELGISDAELKSNAQSLMTHIMHDYSSFCVSTIDAFVQKLSRSFAHDLGLPSQYSVSIDTDEVAETITENLGLRITKKGDYLTDLLIDFSNNQFDSQRSTALESQLSDFIAKLMTEKAYQKDENNNIKDYPQYKQTLDFLHSKMQGFEQGIRKHLDEFERLEKQYSLSDDFYAYGKNGFISYIKKLSAKAYEQPSARFNGVLEKGSCFSKEGEKQLGKTQVDAINAALLPVLQAIKDEVEKGLGQFLFYKTQRDLLYLYALRAQIRMEFAALANEEEVVHISEFNKLLNSVMGDFSVPFVYERIGEHFRHVFVDEFQDTSVLQWQNLLPLIDNGLSSGNMSMVVGDGKQSIYRFRSGEVEQIVNLPEIYALPKDEREAAFRQFEQNLKDNFAFKNLDTNYRSFAQVVSFNNAFFESVYTNLSSDLQKVYVAEKPGTDEGVDIVQKIDKTDEGLVQVELYDAENQPDYCFERVEAIIRDLTETNGYQYSDIALLTRKSDYGSEMANYLNDKGIPVISQDSILLKSSDKVQLMVNTLRYLISGDNETNVANVLYYWRLTQDSGFDGDISQLFGEVKAIANGETAIEPVMGLGEAGLLQGALSKATCLYDLCANLLRIFRFDTIHDAFLNYFMEEVFKSQSGINEGIADFLTYWDTKQDKLAVMSVSGNAVKIMTIHKSKGLEFPVVIYPEAIVDLDEKLNASKAAEEWLRPEDLGFVAIPNLDKVLFKLDKNAANMGEKALEKVNKEKESNRLDNLNLLYVAFTRAVQRLYVIAKQGKEDKPNLLKEFLADKEQFKVLEDGFEEALVYRFGSPDFMKPKEKEKEEKKELKTDSVAGDWFGKIDVDPNPTLVWQSKSDKLLPREWGELVHSILAKIRTSDDMELVLSPYLSDSTIDEKTAGWIRDKFIQMAQNPQIAAAFSLLAKVKTECEILYPNAKGKVIRLDRYAELPDVIYLIDYKTGKKDEEHKNQVQTYSNALREMTDKEILAFLVYLSEKEIDVDGPIG